MATVTKTFKDNHYDSSTYRKTWTITHSISDYTVTGSSFKLPLPTVKLKFVGTSGLYRETGLAQVLKIPRGTAYLSGGSVNWSNGHTKGSSGSTFNGTVYRDSRDTVNTAGIFDAGNKTSKTVNITSDIQYQLATMTSTGTHLSMYSGIASNVTVGTVTLNAPPKITTGTPTSGTIYRTITPYNVPLTSLVGQYGGDIKTVKLTVGSQSISQTYSVNTVSNQTIGLTPTSAGTFTPTLAVTDSRGQTTTKSLPSITVSNYGPPSLSSTAQRADTDGKLADEGTYGLLTANISYYSGAVSGLAQPTVSVTDADGNAVTTTVTWYSSWNSLSGVDNVIDWSSYHPSSPVTIYGKVSTSGGFLTNTSYIMEMNIADSRGSTSGTLAQVLPSAFYTMDIQAGGKEIVFGGPANDNVSSYANGLFKCNMDIMLRDKSDVFRMLVDFMHPVGSYYETSLSSAIPSGSSTPTAADLATLGSTWFNPKYAWGGEWSLESAGKFHVSAGTNYSVGATGGSANAIIPYHRHSIAEQTTQAGTSHSHGAGSYGTDSKGSHAHEPYNTDYQFMACEGTSSAALGRYQIKQGTSSTTTHYFVSSATPVGRYNVTESAGAHSHDVTGTSGGESSHTHKLSAHNTNYAGTEGNTTGANMPPYIAVNRWHRTA